MTSQGSLFADGSTTQGWGAVFGPEDRPDQPYRYLLMRSLVWPLSSDRIVWVMLNPSTADAAVNDPTIRRCMAFARDWGFGLMEVVNLFALRSTDPKALYSAADPVGPDNDAWILRSALTPAPARRVVCAWGAHGAFNGRGDAVLAMLRARGVEPLCLGLTNAGEPRHPLYLAASTRLETMP